MNRRLAIIVVAVAVLAAACATHAETYRVRLPSGKVVECVGLEKDGGDPGGVDCDYDHPVQAR